MKPINPAQEKERARNWLVLNERMLQEARTRPLPLLEKMRRASMIMYNMDAFFSLMYPFLQEEPHRPAESAGDGFLTLCRRIAAGLDGYFQSKLRTDLMQAGIRFASAHTLTKAADLAFLDVCFEKVIFPALTPLVVDASHPFPKLKSRSLNLAVTLERRGRKRLGLVPVPGLLPRCILLPEKPVTYVFLEDVMALFVSRMFSDLIADISVFRVTRAAESSVLVGKSRTLAQGKAVRLEIQRPASPFIRETLMHVLDLDEKDVYLSWSPIDFHFLSGVERDIPEKFIHS
ncbi:hypothetical protein EWH99_02070 [Sporolactobacillus sp. THM7-7]|nr:hypothetical protein EWH99_02070 [Sporolactobacillus sp. THM7-7]